MNYKMSIMVLISIFIISMSNIVLAQDEITEWNIQTQFDTYYIGEKIPVNVTGASNSSFIVRFISISNSNDSFERYYRTDEFGNWSKVFPSFREEQEGVYSIQLIVDELLQGMKVIDIIYNEDQAQWIAIWDGEEWDDRQDMAESKQNEKIEYQLIHYKKWMMYFFIPGFCTLIFLMMVQLVVLWPVIRLWYFKDKKEISDSKRARWTLEFVTGGKPSEDFNEEFPGSIKDDGDGTFEPDDPRVTDDAYGLTEDQLEIARRESHYGKDWETKHPYGSLSDEDFYYPEPIGLIFWVLLSLLIIASIILILSIWFIWYILCPVGIIMLFIVLFLYLKYVRGRAEELKLRTDTEEELDNLLNEG